MKAKRQSTVEPVFGRGLRKINTIGIEQANKVMHLSAMAYNLKKYLKFINKNVRSDAQSLAFLLIQKAGVLLAKISIYKEPEKRVIIS